MRIASLGVVALACVTVTCVNPEGPATAGGGVTGTVAAVVVSPNAVTLAVGLSTRLHALPKDETGNSLTSASIKWTSSDTNVALISDSGVVKANKPGKSNIRARAGGTDGIATVVVTDVPVTSVSVALAVSSLLVGQSTLATAQVKDVNGAMLTGRVVAWTSSNPNLATVSDSGLVTGAAAGTVSITAVSEGVSGSSSLSVAPVPVASVSITPANITLSAGATHQLAATAYDANGQVLAGRTFTWSSSNSAVASVSATGLVSATSAGSAVVSVASEGKTAQSVITVTQDAVAPVASVTVALGASALVIGQNTQGTATLRDSSGNVLGGRTVAWTTSNAGVATVSASGNVTAVAAGSATISAASEGQIGSATVNVSAPAPAPVASVVVSPASASLEMSKTLQLTATLRDASGNVLSGRTITWISSASGLATVSASGLVSALSAGNVTITATSEGKTGTAVITVVAPPPPGTHAGYYVAPSGSSSGDGSTANPWSLATALSGGGGKIHPGDTVWLRDGRYTGTFRNELQGTATSPVVMRQYPGERPIVDGFIDAYGAYTWFWGFEIMQSNAVSFSKRGIDMRGPGHRFINLIVHDVGQSGIGDWMEGVNGEVYGCILYNNGTHASLDHGVYTINRDGTKHLTDNVAFDNYAYGIHVYASPGQALNNVIIDGNASFNNGAIWSGVVKPNLFIGGSSVPATGMVVTNNTLYYSQPVDWMNIRLGYDATQNGSVVVRNNYAVGGTPVINFLRWNDLTVADNTFIGSQNMASLEVLASVTWSGNTWHRDPAATAWQFGSSNLTFAGWQQATGLSADQATATAPSGVRVVVRPNRYEQGRAHIIVNNWALQGSVQADLSGVLQLGDRYQVHSVQDLFGSPVTIGTYGGGSISVPMGAIAPPITIGRTTPRPPTTGPLFDVFLVTKLP